MFQIMVVEDDRSTARLMQALLGHAGYQVVLAENGVKALELLDEIWGMESETVDTTVNVHINRLRKRFDSYPEFEIVSIRGIGYKAVIK